MKRLSLFLVLVFGLYLVGCSDDDPVGSKPQPAPAAVTSTWNASGGYWTTVLDATSDDGYAKYSFATQATTNDVTWDIAFERVAIKLNGGAFSEGGGTAVGADLGVVDFDNVTMADTAGQSWVSDNIDYFIDQWYSYNSVTHQLDMTQYVYSMVDAEGDNYVKFRIDSLVGAGMPPSMGTVWITYYYQPTANSLDLSGALQTASIPVGAGTGYFDFSSGTAVTPGAPGNSTAWDLGFSAYDVFQNSGPKGAGNCAAFLAYTELTDPTDIAGFVAQPAGAPLFTDIPSSVLLDWYEYTGAPLHQILSYDHVYLIKNGADVYKLIIDSYYQNVQGTPTSGWYTFRWVKL